MRSPAPICIALVATALLAPLFGMPGDSMASPARPHRIEAGPEASAPARATSVAPAAAPAATPVAVVNNGGSLTLAGAAAKFGSAVAVAGDVNGDGYSDLIVGAPNYSNGQSGEGEVLLYLGGPNGYSATASWTYESNVAGANLGWSVAPAGDVNGDGYADVIVGAPNLSSLSLTNNGRAYVFLGGPTGLSSTPAWTFDGTQAGELFGWSVCTAGDVNTDGYDDVIVGSPGYSDITAPEDGASRATITSVRQATVVFNNGRARAFLGGPSGLAGSPAWAKSGFQYQGAFGYSVSTAHDVDADGYDDVVVSAPYGENLYTHVTQAGEFDVFPGGASGLSLTPSTVGYGQGTGELRGFSVAGIGDINGDGYADIATGSPGYTNTATHQGAVFVFLGTSSGLDLDFAFLAEGPVFNPTLPGGQFGYSVAPASDVNGDGYADFVVGAPFYTTNTLFGVNVGFVAVFQGTSVVTSSVFTSFARLAFSGSGGSGSELGYAVCAAGDNNGDGFGDVVAGAPTATSNDGRVSVYQGYGDMPSSTPGAVIAAHGPGGNTAGDINGDGYTDLSFPLTLGDEFDLFAGGPQGPGPTPTWTFTSEQLDPSMHFAGEIRSAGDVNGDGYGDIVVGVYVDQSTPSIREFLVMGGPSGPVLSSAWSPAPNRGLEAVGDVNGDGYADIATARTDTLAIYLGGPSGPADLPVWTLVDPGGYDDLFSLGDENGDGYGDFIVQNESVSARVFLGGASGPASTPAITYAIGGFAGPAGDLNGDGLGDYWITTSTGITVYYGNAALSPTVINASATGPQLSDMALCEKMGDLNYDGIDDLAIIGHEPTTKYLGLQVYRGSATGVATTPGLDFGANLSFKPGYIEYWFDSPADVNGDGANDVTVTMGVGPPADSIAMFVLYGNSAITNASGLDRAAVQRQSSDTAPIGLLGLSNNSSQFRIASRGRSAVGRTRVRMESDVKNWASSYETNLANLVHDSWSPTGAPGSDGSFVSLDAARALPAIGPTDKWRMRIAAHSPYFPWTPWLSALGNGRAEYDLRNASSAAAAGVASEGSDRLELAEPWPNPSRAEAHLSFALAKAGNVDLGVFDLQGRRLATLTKGVLDAGAHTAAWDGRDARGEAAGPGMYFARLTTSGQVLTRKLVRMR